MSNNHIFTNSNINDLNIIDSTLSVKCSGINIEQQIQNDLNLPSGKSIAELIYDQEKNGPNT